MESGKEKMKKAMKLAEQLKEMLQTNEVQDVELLQEEPIQKQEEIRLTSRDVIKEIKENIKPKKAPGFDIITEEVLKQLPRKTIVKLTNLVNTAFRQNYEPTSWKLAKVIMILKHGKPPNEVFLQANLPPSSNKTS